MSGSATEPSPPPCVLVIGYGNSLRRDDGAGPFLAAALAARWLAAGRPVRHLAVQQLVPELAEEVAQPSVAAVLFVDAAIAAPRATHVGDASHVGGASHVGDASHVITHIDPRAPSPSVGHHLEPAVLLLYAEHLLGHCPPAWLLTVPGHDFAIGEGFSPAMQAAIDQVLGRAHELWAVLHVK